MSDSFSDVIESVLWKLAETCAQCDCPHIYMETH